MRRRVQRPHPRTTRPRRGASRRSARCVLHSMLNCATTVRRNGTRWLSESTQSIERRQKKNPRRPASMPLVRQFERAPHGRQWARSSNSGGFGSNFLSCWPRRPDSGSVPYASCDGRTSMIPAGHHLARGRGQNGPRPVEDRFRGTLVAELRQFQGRLYRRKWAMERKHWPIRDVAAVGGWKSIRSLVECYAQSDRDTMRAVVNAARTFNAIDLERSRFATREPWSPRAANPAGGGRHRWRRRAHAPLAVWPLTSALSWWAARCRK